jgi:hypothetical protein
LPPPLPHPHRLYIVFYAYNNSEALMNYMDSEYNLHLLMQFSATWVTSLRSAWSLQAIQTPDLRMYVY